MTKRTPSLAVRLASRIAIVQLLAVIGWMLAWMTVSPYVSYEELASVSAAQRVRESVVLEDRPRLVPTPALEAYAARRPGFAYAAVLDGETLPGSTPALTATLAGAVPVEGTVRLADGTIVNAQPVAIASGQLVVLSTGNGFRSEDVPVFFTAYVPQLVGMFGPALLAGALLAVPLVRRALRPVDQAAGEAARIDIGSLGRRLPEEGLPREVAPFAAAINRLLGRLEQGVTQQRLFAASAAHELRTPVAILAARVDALDESNERTELRRDVARLSLLVDQLLAADRLKGPAPARGQPILLGPFLRDVVADHAPLGLRSGRALEVEILDADQVVVAELEALRSAVGNLVSNALRAEPHGGTVVARVSRDSSWAAIEIEDHGDGIGAAVAEQVFEPFWRGDAPSPGSGLGLAVTRTIAEALGGDVTHRPTPGGGTTFRLRLPTVPATQNS